MWINLKCRQILKKRTLVLTFVEFCIDMSLYRVTNEFIIIIQFKIFDEKSKYKYVIKRTYVQLPS